jgi:hypothetical protein
VPAHQPETRDQPCGAVRAIVKKLQRLQDTRIDVVNQCSIEIKEHDGGWRQI